MNETNSLAIFTKAALMLAEADTIQKAKELKSLALTAAEWAKRKRMGEDAIKHCHSYALEAERKMGEMLAATERAKGAKGVGPAIAVTPRNRNAPPTLAEIGVTKRESAEAQLLAELPKDEFEKLKSGAVTKTQVKRKQKEKKREAKRKENAKKVAKVRTPNQMVRAGTKFSTIVIDPPWDWGDENDKDQLGRAKPDYKTMDIESLRKLPVDELADKDCHIYLWITNRSLPKGFDLLERWGFRYIVCLTWPKPSFGMGNYFRGQTEHVLFGVKGSLGLNRKNASTLLPSWKRGPNGHSSKPSEFNEFVESCSPGPYLEMFSRSNRKGWKQWGENG